MRPGIPSASGNVPASTRRAFPSRQGRMSKLDQSQAEPRKQASSPAPARLERAPCAGSLEPVASAIPPASTPVQPARSACPPRPGCAASRRSPHPRLVALPSPQARPSAPRPCASRPGSSARPPSCSAWAMPPVAPPEAACPTACACSRPGSFLPSPSLPSPSNPSRWLSATQNNRCRMCGAPTLAAHRSAAPQAYPKSSKSARTPANHSRPAALVTCSPKTVAGRHLAMSA